MKKRLIFSVLFTVALIFALSISVCAATTNEFGTTEEIEGIDLTDMNTDTTARVVIVDENGEYHTYPAQYVVSNNTKFYYNFKPINDALGASYTKNSVVRIEVPDNILIATNCGDLSQTSSLVEIKFSPSSQLHTLEYGCFYNNKKLEKLNIPPLVTTISTLIISQSTITELVFMDGFSAFLPANSFTGASGLKRLVLSNQMTTMHPWAFNNTINKQVEEIRFGESLLDIGEKINVNSNSSDGGNFSYLQGNGITRLYVSEKFFSQIDTIEKGHTSGWTGESAKRGVVFYTGTKEQAQALVDKADSTAQVFYGATLLEWDPTKEDTDATYQPSSGWIIVYNYNKCRAFYENQHDEQPLNGCQFGCARGCGAVAMLENPVHSFVDTVTYGGKSDVNYYLPISTCETCENCKTQNGEAIEIDPLFTDKGYAVCLDDVGITYKFSVNLDAIKLYKQHVSSNFEYGVVASKNEGTPLSIIDGEVEASAETISAAMQLTYYGYFEVKVTGIGNENAELPIVCCGYVRDGNDIYYISEGVSSSSASGKTYKSFLEKE